jgi:two-component system chemotaxis sensor kinase CheA
MVRDLSRELGKEVDLVCEGRDTEFDRSLLEHLGDPLVHLLRNAVDHGIEFPDDRVAAGKPRRGTLRIDVYRDRDNVVFTVSDDGKGMNREAIAKKALALGFITEAEVDALDMAEAIELTMRPGFSTADEVSKVSGRGVGLDVVRHSVRSLGGTVTVDSGPGRGTQCTMSLPITLAIIKAFLVQVGGEEYAIPSGHVLEVLAVAEPEMRLVNNQWLLPREEGVLPLVQMEEALEVVRRTGRDDRPKTVVVVGMESKRVGLVFDRLVEQQDIVVKGLGSLLRPVEGFTGVTIGGDGRPVLILDVAGFA